MVTKIGSFQSSGLTNLGFCLWCWMVNEVYITKEGTSDELLPHILDIAACIKKGEDQLRRTTRDLSTRVAKCIEGDGGDFRISIVNCNK